MKRWQIFLFLILFLLAYGIAGNLELESEKPAQEVTGD